LCDDHCKVFIDMILKKLSSTPNA